MSQLTVNFIRGVLTQRGIKLDGLSNAYILGRYAHEFDPYFDSLKLHAALKCAPGNFQCGGACVAPPKHCSAPLAANTQLALSLQRNLNKAELKTKRNGLSYKNRYNGRHDDINEQIRQKITSQSMYDGIKYFLTEWTPGSKQQRKPISKDEYNDLKNHYQSEGVLDEKGRIANKDSLIKGTARLLGLSGYITAQMVDSINYFTKEGTDPSNLSYKKIRDFEKGRISSDHPEYKQIKQHSELINKYIQKAPKFDGVIARGIGFKTEKDRNKFLSSLESSTGYTLGAVSSFSSSNAIAEKFASQGDYSVVLVVSKNKSGVSIRNLSDNPLEDEVIVPKGATYKATGKSYTVGKTVYVEALNL